MEIVRIPASVNAGITSRHVHHVMGKEWSKMTAKAESSGPASATWKEAPEAETRR